MEAQQGNKRAQGNLPKATIVGRTFFRWLAVTFSVLLVVVVAFQLIFYFYTNEIVGNVIKGVVDLKSDGLYTLSYSDIRLDFVSRKLTIQDLRLDVDSNRLAEIESEGIEKQSLTTFYIPRVIIKDHGQGRFFLSQRMRIKNLIIDRPEIYHNQLVSDSSTFKEFTVPDVHALLAGYLEGVHIEDLLISDGLFGFRNAASKSFTVQKINVELTGIVIEEENRENNEWPLEADSLGVLILHNQFYNADSSLRVEVDRIKVLPEDSLIRINGIYIESLEGKEPVSVQIPVFRLTGVDFNLAYRERILEMAKIIVKSPKARLFVPKGSKASRQVDFEKRNAYQLIKDYFSFLFVKSIEVDDAAFDVEIEKPGTNSHLTLNPVHIAGYNLLLDSLSEEQRRGQFYLEDIDVVINNYQRLLPDNIHRFEVEEMGLSTAQSRLYASNLNIRPTISEQKLVSSGLVKRKNLYTLSVPSMVANEIDLWQLYLDRILSVGEVALSQPKLYLFSNSNLRADKTKSFDLWNLYPLIEDDLNSLTIHRFEIQNASFDFSKSKNEQADLLSIRDVSLGLDEFQLDTNSKNNEKTLFYSDNFEARVNDIVLLLSDSTHLVELEKVVTSSRDGSFRADRFHLRPAKDRQHWMGREDSIHTHFFDIDLHALSLAGINFGNAYYHRSYEVDEVDFHRPKVAIYRNKSRLGQKDSTETIKAAFLSDYFQRIAVGRVGLDSGSLALYSRFNSQYPVMKARNIEVCLLDLLSDSLELANNKLVARSHDVDVRVKDYSIFLDDSLHQLTIDEIHASRAASEVILSKVRIHPPDKYKSLGKENLIQIDIPEIRLAGTDIQKGFIDRQLNVDTLMLRQPSLEVLLHGNTKKKGAKTFDESKVRSELLKMFSEVEVKHLSLQKGDLNLLRYHEEQAGATTIDDFALEIDGFKVAKDEPAKDEVLFSDDLRLKISGFGQAVKDTLYTFEIEEVRLSTGDSTLQLDSIQYQPKKGLDFHWTDEASAEQDWLDALVPRTSLSGIDYKRLMGQNELSVSQIDLETPFLRVLKTDPKRRPRKPSFKGLDPQELQKFLSPIFNAYSVAQFNIHHASVDQLTRVQHYSRDRCLYNLSAYVENFDLDSASMSKTDSVHFAKDLKVELTDYSFNTQDSLYQLAFDRIAMSAAKGRLEVDTLKLIPRTDKFRFAVPANKQMDWIDLQSDFLFVEHIDVHRLLTKGEFSASQLVADGLDMEVFRDKRLPFPEDQKPLMPQDHIRNAKFYLKIDSAKVLNSNIEYEEYALNGIKEGKITFNDLQVKATNITNDTAILNDGAVTTMTGKARLMGEGLLEANFRFDLGDVNNRHSFEGTLQEMEMGSLNPMLEHVAFVKIKKGKVKKMQLNVTANDEYAFGSLKLHYEKLGVSLIDRVTHQVGFGEKMGAMLANTFIVHTHNPKFIFPRKGHIYYERDIHRSIFNYWARTTFNGLQNSVGTKLVKTHSKSKYNKKRKAAEKKAVEEAKAEEKRRKIEEKEEKRLKKIEPKREVEGEIN